MKDALINRYKQMRTERFLKQTCGKSYAFVGMGQHSLTNLYPALAHLQVPLKYICVTSDRKAQLISQKFQGVKATARLDDILADDAVGAIFLAASPAVHYSLASKILSSGKALFVEKPPCQTLAELEQLQALQQKHHVSVVMTGLQKRYAPVTALLRKRLAREELISYDLHYLTGAYPEGDALTDLYIHPLDLVNDLFGQPEVMACQQTDHNSFLLMLRHQNVTGTLELSTAYTWTGAEETLKVCTRKGIYLMTQMEQLTFTPKPGTILGIPMEKVMPHCRQTEYLCERNNFSPIPANNQVVSQGFMAEISAFVDAVEGRGSNILTSLASIRGTYLTIESLRQATAPTANV